MAFLILKIHATSHTQNTQRAYYMKYFIMSRYCSSRCFAKIILKGRFLYMDKLIFDISPIIIGRTEDLLQELSDRNASYSNLCKDIRTQRNYLKENLDKSTWLQVKSLIRLLMKRNSSDNQYLYCQGLRDCAFLSNITNN